MVEKKIKKKKPVSKACSRHSCSIKTSIKKCKYCESLFCKKHMLGFAPHVGIDESFDKRKDPNSGHPCYPYIKYKEDKKKEKEETYRKDLNAFLDVGKSSKVKYSNKPIHSYVKDYSTSHRTKKKKEIHEVAIERFEAKRKKKSKKSNKKIKIPIKGILYFIFAIGIIALVYFNLGQIISFIDVSNNDTNISNEVIIDSQTLEAFSYINNYRLESGSSELIYSKELYELVKEVTKEKNIDSNLFESNSEFLEKIKSQFDVSKMSFSFYETYFIGGEGLEGFYKKFDKNYGARNLIKNNKYNFGAVYCSLDYCVLFVYTSENELESVVENIQVPAIDSDLSINVDDSTDISEEFVGGSVGLFKPKINILSLEKEIHDLINIERVNYGLDSLYWDSEISDVSRKHSQDMAVNNYFEHVNLLGEDPTDRARREGYSCYKDYGSYYTEGLAENIFQNNLYDSVTTINLIPFHDWNTQSEIAKSTVQGWMNSQGHRENILNGDYTKEGIGISVNDDDEVYITENFC